MRRRSLLFLSALPLILLIVTGGLRAQQRETGPAARRVIIFVWDGLRADDLTQDIAPNYFALARSGVMFADHYAVYPTFTMMNSASIATGTYPGVHGFYGNVVYVPSAKGRNAKGGDIDFSAPAFIEDFGVVEAVREAYGGKLTLVPTMLQAISLMASGRDFKSGLQDTLPTCNVDIAPTVARILQFSMPAVQGRVLDEALQGGPPLTDYEVLNNTHRSSTRTGLTVKLPTDLDGRSVDRKLTTYSAELKTKSLARGGVSYTYFDQGKAVRE
jgi:arylsulfatase A-like enzyme